MTLTLTLDRVTRHTVVYHSSTSTIYKANFIEIGKDLLVRTDAETGFLPFLLGRLGGVDLKIEERRRTAISQISGKVAGNGFILW